MPPDVKSSGTRPLWAQTVRQVIVGIHPIFRLDTQVTLQWFEVSCIYPERCLVTSTNFDHISDLDVLLTSGLFNRYWYSAQSDRYFATETAAGEDFLTNGMSKEMSPHPLMDSRTWPTHLRQAWKQGKFKSVIAWFRKPLKDQPAIGPLLAPQRLDTSSGVITEHDPMIHVGGTLGWLLEHAPDDFVVDSMFGPWVWGDVRASWKGVVDTIKVQTYKSRPRLQGKWDFAKENNWRQSLEGVNLPSIPENDTLVSIVMPAWNRADLITRAVRSVQRQTLQEWELIVVDDGSTDSTCDVVRLLAMADKRIKLVEAPHGGVCAARNIGLKIGRASCRERVSRLV